jgi:RNA polymerase sigma-70 factor (ECF subfamily)
MRYHDTLWEKVQQGNAAAFRQLFDTYWEELFLYACRILKDRSTAKDIIQALFIHLWEKHDGLPDVDNIPAYLRTALRNRLLNAIRDENVYQKHVDIFSEIAAGNDNSLLESLEVKDTEHAILASMDALPAKMKNVFYLHRFEHLSVTEIALKLGTSEQTIRNQLNTALQRVRARWSTIIPLLCYFLLP